MGWFGRMLTFELEADEMHRHSRCCCAMSALA